VWEVSCPPGLSNGVLSISGVLFFLPHMWDRLSYNFERKAHLFYWSHVSWWKIANLSWQTLTDHLTHPWAEVRVRVSKMRWQKECKRTLCKSHLLRIPQVPPDQQGEVKESLQAWHNKELGTRRIHTNTCPTPGYLPQAVGSPVPVLNLIQTNKEKIYSP
jgi:hypothetical protein